MSTPIETRYERALRHLSEPGITLTLAADGAVLVPSASTPGVVYRVAGDVCSCPDGGRRCWHVTAAATFKRRLIADLSQRLAQARADLYRCRCGGTIAYRVEGGEASYCCEGCGQGYHIKAVKYAAVAIGTAAAAEVTR
jgi:hypothetical protein